MRIVYSKMPLLRFPKMVEHPHKIKIGKSFKLVDSDCFTVGVQDFTRRHLMVFYTRGAETRGGWGDISPPII